MLALQVAEPEHSLEAKLVLHFEVLSRTRCRWSRKRLDVLYFREVADRRRVEDRQLRRVLAGLKQLPHIEDLAFLHADGQLLCEVSEFEIAGFSEEPRTHRSQVAVFEDKLELHLLTVRQG